MTIPKQYSYTMDFLYERLLTIRHIKKHTILVSRHRFELELNKESQSILFVKVWSNWAGLNQSASDVTCHLYARA